MSGNVTQFQWQIDDFSVQASLDGPNSVLLSDAFRLNGTDLWFRLEFLPTNLDFRNYSSIFVRSKPLIRDPCISIRCSFWIENNAGHWIGSIEEGYDWYLDPLKTCTGYDNFVHHQQLYTPREPFILADDQIYICCQMEIIHNSPPSRPINIILKSNVTAGVIVRAGTEKFYLERHLLCNSESFYRLLNSNDPDAKRGVIVIPDVRPEATEAMLNYICFGSTKMPICRYVEDIFVVACKFDIDGLIKICLSAMNRTFTVRNVVYRLLIAYQCQNEDLQYYAVSYIRNFTSAKNFDSYFEDKKWNDLISYCPELGHKLKETILKVVCK